MIASSGTRVITDFGNYFKKAEEAFLKGEYESAVSNVQEAIKLNPDWEDAHYLLALALAESGKLKEAIEAYEQVIRLAATNELRTVSYYNLGNAHADLGNYSEAISAYNRSIELSPKLSKPHNNLGLAYAASNRLPEAAVEFNRAVRLKPDYSEARYNLGLTNVYLGRRSQARQQYNVLLKLNGELAARLGDLIKGNPPY